MRLAIARAVYCQSIETICLPCMYFVASYCYIACHFAIERMFLANCQETSWSMWGMWVVNVRVYTMNVPHPYMSRWSAMRRPHLSLSHWKIRGKYHCHCRRPTNRQSIVSQFTILNLSQYQAISVIPIYGIYRVERPRDGKVLIGLTILRYFFCIGLDF